MRIAVVLGLLFSMSDCIQPAVQQMEIEAAVAAPAPVERVRRLERSAAAAQPPVEESHKRHPNQRWQAYAQVERPAGGKNKARKLEKLGPFHGPTKEVAEAARNAAIDNYLHEPEKKRKKEPVGSSSAAPMQEEEPASTRPKRDAAPSAPGALKMPNVQGGAQPGQRGAGPGRGHVKTPGEAHYERLEQLILERDLLPPAGANQSDWLTQQALKKQWETRRTQQLEERCRKLECELMASMAREMAKDEQIANLSATIERLQAEQRMVAEQIVSYIQSTPILKEAAHAKKLEEHPEWAVVLGLGYDDAQKRNMIYNHLGKLQSELRRVTNGDAMKAKQLTDLLYTRVHAGEQRMLDKTDKAKAHDNAVNAGIVASLAQFVQALHDAGGDGRYPEKIRQAQQVIASAVSKAAALSPTNTSISEISSKLGLSARMVSKCQARFDALTDGEWEEALR